MMLGRVAAAFASTVFSAGRKNDEVSAARATPTTSHALVI
jgi:hypothetical protein